MRHVRAFAERFVDALSDACARAAELVLGALRPQPQAQLVPVRVRTRRPPERR